MTIGNDSLFNMDDSINDMYDNMIIVLDFPTIQRSMILDIRSIESVQPLIKLEEGYRSPQSIARFIARNRKHLPKPIAISITEWTSIKALSLSKYWTSIFEHIKNHTQNDSITDCNKAIKELLRHEHEELSNAILGENYATLWDRSYNN